METRKTTALTTVITGLRKFTNYSLQVLAFTKVGDGVHTSTIYCQTDEDGKKPFTWIYHTANSFRLVPGPPADIKVIISSPQALLVSWLPPFERNGVITKYNIYKRSMDGKQEGDHIKQIISSQHTNFEVKSVQPMTEYQFWVTASTRIGEGQSSRVVSQVASQRGVFLRLGWGLTQSLYLSYYIECPSLDAFLYISFAASDVAKKF